jgi:hypothetical protein
MLYRAESKADDEKNMSNTLHGLRVGALEPGARGLAGGHGYGAPAMRCGATGAGSRSASSGRARHGGRGGRAKQVVPEVVRLLHHFHVSRMAAVAGSGCLRCAARLGTAR